MVELIAAQIWLNLSIEPADFDYGEFFDKGGRLGAIRALGAEWTILVEQMNNMLAVR